MDAATLAEIRNGVGEGTAMLRSHAIMCAMVNGLKYLPGRVPATRLGACCEGVDVLIVGAGMSLHEHADEVKERAKSSLVFAVNTAAPRLAQMGVPIDLLVSIEAVDTSEQLRASAGNVAAYCIDVAAHDNVWRAAIDSGKPVLWSACQTAHGMEVLDALEVQPVYMGGAAVTCAAALAYQWGARSIGLVGIDCARADGQTYAPGTAWGALRFGWGKTDDEKAETRIVYTGTEERDALHDRCGIARIPNVRKPYPWPCNDGTEGFTTAEILDQFLWFSEWRAGLRRDVHCWTIADRGARIDGWTTERPAPGPGGLSVGFLDRFVRTPYDGWIGDDASDVPETTPAQIESLRDLLRQQAADCERIAEEMIAGRFDYAAGGKHGVVDGLMSGRIMRDRAGDGMSLHEQWIGAYTVMRNAARELTALISEQDAETSGAINGVS